MGLQPKLISGTLKSGASSKHLAWQKPILAKPLTTPSMEHVQLIQNEPRPKVDYLCLGVILQDKCFGSDSLATTIFLMSTLQDRRRISSQTPMTRLSVVSFGIQAASSLCYLFPLAKRSLFVYQCVWRGFLHFGAVQFKDCRESSLLELTCDWLSMFQFQWGAVSAFALDDIHF